MERVNDLFMELNAWKLQLEEEERNLQRKKKQLNIQSSKNYYKKKLKPLVLSKAQERFQKKSLKYAPSSTPEGCRSTSPDESPFKIPPKSRNQPQLLNLAAAASSTAAAAASESAFERPQVRINPLYFPSEQSAPATDHVFDVPITISSSKRTSPKSRFPRVSTLCFPRVVEFSRKHRYSHNMFKFGRKFLKTIYRNILA